MHYRIVLDDFDRAETPHDPITLNVQVSVDGEWENIDDPIVGDHVPDMLRTLASCWEGTYA